jgi:hypothetical protein
MKYTSNTAYSLPLPILLHGDMDIENCLDDFDFQQSLQQQQSISTAQTNNNDDKYTFLTIEKKIENSFCAIH